MKPWGLKLAMNVPVVICQTWGLWSESRTSCSNQQRLEKKLGFDTDTCQSVGLWGFFICRHLPLLPIC